MPDSLVIGTHIELMGGPGGVPSTLPALQNSSGLGAIFQVLAPQAAGAALGYQGSYDFGTPQPTTDIVQSLLLDGERPFGYRSSNRTVKLPVKITAPDLVTMTAARELLMQVVDQQTWVLTWTPASTGLPLVFDCFRALPSTVGYGFLYNELPIAVMNLEFQALPYGRSDDGSLTSVAFSSPLLGGISAPPNPVVLDNFGTVSGTNWTRSTAKYVTGPSSAHYTPPGGSKAAAVYTKSGLSVSITGLPAMSVWLGLSASTGWSQYAAYQANMTLAWTLTDNAGRKLTFHRTYPKTRWSNQNANPAWTRVTAPIPQGNAVFNYTNVTAYSVSVTNWTSGSTTGLVNLNVWLDNVTANPPSLAIPASQRGVVYTIMGAMGTARTPFSAQFQLPQAGPVSTELLGSGVWWPPAGVSTVQAECVGAGGAGSTRTSAGQGGGGGGGEYAKEASLTVSPGTPVPYACGTGGSPAANAVTITFTTPGTGNWTCPAGVTTIIAECWGAGAGGAPGGGGGGGGEYAKETALAVTAGKNYRFTVGAGGSGGGTAAPGGTVQQRNGLTSTFAGDSVTVTANGGKTGLSGGTTAGAGGTGSANTTHFSGGAGGTAPAGGGGGGGSSAGTASNGTAGSAGSGNTGGTGATGPSGSGNGGTGATNPGYPAPGVSPGGAGGGGFSASYNGGGGNGAGGQVKLTYTPGAGSPISGGTTTFGSAATTGTVVTANGGGSAPNNSTTAGTAGSGSSNTTHFSGGAGGLGGTAGGGGGGSGGSASAGNAGTAGASGGTGAAAVTGGGKGGAGGAAGDNAGTPASPPGGGGGGASMAATAQAGGTGGPGGIVLTWTPPLAQFGTLIAHRPGTQAPDSLNPCVPVQNTADAPSGIEYPVPSLISGVNALFGGTYSVVLVNYAWDNPTASRVVSVTVNQYEYVGGPAYSATATRTITPSTDISNGLIVMGEMTLPIKDIDPSNTSAYFTVAVNDTDQADQFLDVLFLDTQGQTVIVNIPAANTYTNFFIDEPTPDRDLGRIMGSDLDRSQAISVLDAAIVSGGPFYLNPGDNTFLAYSPSGAPNLGVSYLARWFTDRLS